MDSVSSGQDFFTSPDFIFYFQAQIASPMSLKHPPILCWGVLCGLIKVVAFWGFGFCLEVMVSLQPNRDFARKEELKRFYGRRRYRGDFSSKIREETFKRGKPENRGGNIR